MPRRNRVTPLGELVATPDRGLVYGNRGCLHDPQGQVRRAFATRRWIACRLRFRGWHRSPLMRPGRFTELFFLDEATAFAAGHRPCALCRREDYNAFARAWDGAGADGIDVALHEERYDAATRGRRLHDAALDDLPDGAMVLGEDGDPWMVCAGELLRWTTGGYTDRRPRPAGAPARLITPPSFVAALDRGWEGVVPLVHPSA